MALVRGAGSLRIDAQRLQVGHVEVAAVHPASVAAHVAVVRLVHSMKIRLPIIGGATVLAVHVPATRVITAIVMVAPARISTVIIASHAVTGAANVTAVAIGDDRVLATAVRTVLVITSVVSVSAGIHVAAALRMVGGHAEAIGRVVVVALALLVSVLFGLWGSIRHMNRNA